MHECVGLTAFQSESKEIGCRPSIDGRGLVSGCDD